MSLAPHARTIVVTGGCTGIGRTHVAANLAVAFQQQGRNTVLVDLDLDGSHWRKVVGVVPHGTLADVLGGRTRLEDQLAEGPGGIRLLRGGPELEQLALLPRAQQETLLGEVRTLGVLFDGIVLDTGIGASTGVMTFVRSADEVIALATPERTALNDAYGALKLVSQRHPGTMMSLCMNFAVNEQQGREAAFRLIGIARSFLHADVRYAGSIRRDGAVSRAEREGRPVVLTFPTSAFARDVLAMASRCLQPHAVPGPTLAERLQTELAQALRPAI